MMLSLPPFEQLLWTVNLSVEQWNMPEIQQNNHRRPASGYEGWSKQGKGMRQVINIRKYNEERYHTIERFET